jgi:hypothetical protein
MTKKKQQLTEELDGIGELAGLVQHGAPRRGEGFGGGYPRSPPPKRNMCASMCGHAWHVCVADVCAGAG